MSEYTPFESFEEKRRKSIILTVDAKLDEKILITQFKTLEELQGAIILVRNHERWEKIIKNIIRKDIRKNKKNPSWLRAAMVLGKPHLKIYIPKGDAQHISFLFRKENLKATKSHAEWMKEVTDWVIKEIKEILVYKGYIAGYEKNLVVPYKQGEEEDFESGEGWKE